MKLFATYGITPAALQALTGSGMKAAAIPDGWFDWVRTPEVRRLNRVDLKDRAAAWCRDAVANGLEPVLVAAAEESPHLAPSKLPDTTRCILVSRDEADADVRALLLDVLRDPDEWLVANWAATTLGGPPQDSRLTSVAMDLWWACGVALRRWMRTTARWEITGVDPVPLDADWLWRDWAQPCTPEHIPALKRGGCTEYFPMRTLPCCGIVRRWDGTLAACGALQDDRNEKGHWRWDPDGRLAARLGNAPRRTFAAWLQEAFGAMSCVPWQPAAGSMSGSLRSAPVDFPAGGRVLVEWSDDEATVTPMSGLGSGPRVWISAVQEPETDGALRVLWSCPFRYHVERTTRGIRATRFFFVVTPQSLEEAQ